MGKSVSLTPLPSAEKISLSAASVLAAATPAAASGHSPYKEIRVSLTPPPSAESVVLAAVPVLAVAATPVAAVPHAVLAASLTHSSAFGDSTAFDVFNMELKKENLQEIQNKLTNVLENSKSTLAQVDIEKLKQFKTGIEQLFSSNIRAKSIIHSLNAILKKIEVEKARFLSAPATAAALSKPAAAVTLSVSALSSARMYATPKYNPINETNLKAWIDAHPSDVKGAVRALAGSIIHISHHQFMDTLTRMLFSFKHFIKTHEPFEYVSAVQVGKSNKWVS